MANSIIELILPLRVLHIIKRKNSEHGNILKGKWVINFKKVFKFVSRYNMLYTYI